MKKYNQVYESHKLINKIKTHKVVSFDIFDTLVKRDCGEPTDVFDLLETQLGSEFEGFAKARRLTEQKWLEDNVGKEITLDDIYSALECAKGWESETLKAKEIEMELNLCQKNRIMQDVYEYALSHCESVILVTDMYLPRDVIVAILNNLNITGYKYLFISSEIGKTKRAGQLYKYVIDELNGVGLITKNSDVVHIGDSFKSDYIRSKLCGLRSIHIPKCSYDTRFLCSGKPLNDEQRKEYLSLMSYISNHHKKETSWFEQIGYEALGPVLYGFSKWILSQVEKEGINKVFFLSRDGQLMKKSYEYMQDEQRNVYYMYGSRRALIVPTLWTCKNFEEMFASMFIPRMITLNDIITKLGLDEVVYENRIQEFGLKYNVFYEFDSLKRDASFIRFLEEVKEDIVNNSTMEYHRVVDYLKSIDFNGKIALVDIGWHGNMQKALKKICRLANIDVTMLGLYVGIKPYGTDAHCEMSDGENDIWARGYLFSPESNQFLFNYQKNFTHIFEMMFVAEHGSVKCFNEELEPVFYEFEYDININEDVKRSYDAIIGIQRGALRLVNELCHNRYCNKTWDSSVGFQNLLVLGNFPNKEMVINFGELLVMDDKTRKIVTTHCWSDYLKHPGKLLQDYNASYWKIGYFHKLFGFNVPYYLLRDMVDRIKASRRKRK